MIDLRQVLAEENNRPHFCYLRWRMRIREEILDKVPSFEIPEEISDLLFCTSPGEDEWYNEFSSLVKFVNDSYNLYPPSEDSSPETDSETDFDED
jgi:hypothetical protein